MQTTEVTQGQWEKVMGNNPSCFNEGDNRPVEQVSWNGDKVFFPQLNSKSNGHYHFRLLTEAEWEYECRSGGKKEKYSGSGEIDEVAWFGSNSKDSTQPVETKAPNVLDIYDMSGNVYEWFEDIYSENAYSQHQLNNPIYSSKGSSRVNRGGSWYNGARFCRSAYRNRYDPHDRGSYLGFRLARTKLIFVFLLF
jgi:formylglycine-generating enzyme required for sulfatase activity